MLLLISNVLIFNIIFLKFHYLQTLNENHEKVINLCQIFKNSLSVKALDNDSISKFLKNLLELRLKEIADFQSFHQLMKKFLKFLQAYANIANKGSKHYNFKA